MDTGSAEIPFLDLARNLDGIKAEVEEAIAGVVSGGHYILGPEVNLFEKEFAAYLGCSAAVGVASGTDAITLSLKALSIGAGDAVVTTPFTAPPTAMAIRRSGARTVLADIEEGGYGLDAGQVRRNMTPDTRAVVPVHLFGEVVDMEAMCSLADETGAVLVEDACQAHGAESGGRMAGTMGTCGCFSFYPTKNLGALGDGGLVATDDRGLAAHLRSLRDYGRTDRDTFTYDGFNSRLDEIQAAVLRVKLRHLDALNRRRRELAGLYLGGLQGLPLDLPSEKPGRGHVYHLFVIGTDERDLLVRSLAQQGIQTCVHYPIPIHLQPVMADLGYAKGDFPRAEAAAGKVLSLPLNPSLSEEQVEKICRSIRNHFGG